MCYDWYHEKSCGRIIRKTLILLYFRKHNIEVLWTSTLYKGCVPGNRKRYCYLSLSWRPYCEPHDEHSTLHQRTVDTPLIGMHKYFFLNFYLFFHFGFLPKFLPALQLFYLIIHASGNYVIKMQKCCFNIWSKWMYH